MNELEFEIRRRALELAVSAHVDNKNFPATNARDGRTPQVVATALAFEAFLRGPGGTDA